MIRPLAIFGFFNLVVAASAVTTVSWISFEAGEGLVVGPIAGQQTWTGAGAGFEAGGSVVTYNPVFGTKSLHINSTPIIDGATWWKPVNANFLGTESLIRAEWSIRADANGFPQTAAFMSDFKVDFHSSSSKFFAVRISETAGDVQYETVDGQWTSTLASAAKGQWHSVSAVLRGSNNTATIFLNGEIIATEIAIPETLTNLNSMRIGVSRAGLDFANVDAASIVSMQPYGGSVDVRLPSLSFTPTNWPMRIEVLDRNTGAILKTTNVNLDRRFRAYFDGPGVPGVYDLRIKARGHLSKRINGVNLDSDEAFGLVVSPDVLGDIVGDNVIDLSDYTQVAIAFNTTAGDSNYFTPNADGIAPLDCDLNRDGAVDLTDYTVVATNFNRIGD